MTPAKQKKHGVSGRRKRASVEESSAQPAAGEGSRSRFPIVGIGASAGGLEAFTLFLRALSSDLNMAFVLVPHLDPVRESAFTQILTRTTSMPVVEITEQTRPEPNHVYIIPRNCSLTVSSSVLHISDREEHRGANSTIDIFMRSLASDQGSNAIGVILSGTGADGTVGLTAIKGEGGITFAQDTQSAKYDGMPASAIASGFVDFILPPQEIAAELARIRDHPYVAGSDRGGHEDELEGCDSRMAQIFLLLRRLTKVDFSEYKQPTIHRRIQRRMALHKIENMGEYVALLHRDRGEVSALYKDLLISVTSFFRNPEAFAALKAVVYPAILEARGSSSFPIRIWVPGCSTGEEPYSVAMSLVEYLDEERREIPIQIFGTDLSEGAIQSARAGIYKESIEADVNPARLRRFFHIEDGGYQISKSIRDLCIFSTQNVFNDPPFSRLDMVSCRNVMIYLSQALQKRVIPIFHYALNPTGFLMMGNTEGLLGAGSELFEMADKKQKIYRKRLVSTPIAFGFSMGQSEGRAEEGIERPARAPKSADTQKAPVELQREGDRLLLGRYAPPAVVVNEQLEIIQSRGRTGPYLELSAGKASLNLLKMARPGLLFELRSAIEEARKRGVETTRENIHVDGKRDQTGVTVRVIPFKTPTHDQPSFLIVFESEAPGAERRPAAASMPLTEAEKAERDTQIAQLNQELAATKEYLQAIIEAQEATNEALQSANEEIQSGNEELQSTNEELQTSKEELESANEELHTVNEEMQQRNELLSQLNNDLTNLLNGVSLPMVMVGGDLSVRRFTLQATAALGLDASDVGRPMPRLKLKIDSCKLEQMMLDVIRDVESKQYQVQDNDGEWCSLRIAPYRTLDNRIDGVVITILDKNVLRGLANGSHANLTPEPAKPAQEPQPRKGAKRRQ